MVDEAIDYVLESPPVDVTMEAAVNMGKALRGQKRGEIYSNLIDYMSKQYPSGITVEGLGNVKVNRDSAHSIVAHAQPHGITIPKWGVISQLGELLGSSVLFAQNIKWKGRNWDSLNTAVPMRLGDQDKIVEFTIKRKLDGELELYNLRVVMKEKIQRTEDSTRHKPYGEPGTNSSLNTAHSISNSPVEVNHHITEKSHAAEKPTLPTSNLMRQYLAAHGLLGQFLQK